MKTSSSVDLLNSLTKNSTSTSAAKSTDQKDPFGTPVSVQPPTESFANFDNANIFSSKFMQMFIFVIIVKFYI